MMSAKDTLTLTLVLLPLLCSCGTVKRREIAGQGVDQFHSQLDSEQYAIIYSESDEGLRTTTTQEDFVRLLQAMTGPTFCTKASERVYIRV